MSSWARRRCAHRILPLPSAVSFFLRNNAGVKLLSGSLLPYASDIIPVLTHPLPCSRSLIRCSKRRCACFAAISHISLENRRIRSTSALQKICGNYIRCFLVQRLGFEVGKQGLPVAFSQGSPDPKKTGCVDGGVFVE